MNSKTVIAFASLFAASLSAQSAWADASTDKGPYSVTLSNVHLCCDSCVKDAGEAVGAVTGASADSDKASHTVKITASDQATAQKAVDALIAAGYYGQPSDPAIKVAQATVPAGNVKSLTVSGVHLCCKKCVTAVNKAVAKVKGVAGTTAAKDAESFEITGDFNAPDVIAALNEAGFSAKVN